MNKKLMTITIGIPAYNEEANIGHLLMSLKSQKLSGLVIDKIIVNSDGSNDETAKIVKSFNSPNIVLLDDGKRKGQSARQNEIIMCAKTDILVLLNADIKLSGEDYIQLLCEPIRSGADLVSSNVQPMPPKGFIEKTLKVSYDYKEEIFESIDKGNNIYTCKGAARSMSTRFYSNFRFDKSVGEDAYTYLYAKHNNLRYFYQPKCTAFIRLPNNVSDYLKQSTRFLDSKARFVNEFGIDFVNRQYSVPKKVILKVLLKNLIRQPLLMGTYLVFFALSSIKLKTRTRQEKGDVWEIAKSSKKLV
jgi:glycosyltransferase involved in cell wall biosynthesis